MYISSPYFLMSSLTYLVFLPSCSSFTLNYGVSRAINVCSHIIEVTFDQAVTQVKCTTTLKNTLDENNESIAHGNTRSQKNIDKTWRYIKKPLLRIGTKGVAKSHGNSLRELLNAHKVVKVKFNYSENSGDVDSSVVKDDSLSDNERRRVRLLESFKSLKNVTEQSGQISEVELVQLRPSENIVMFGIKGILDEIENGNFPSE